MQKRTQQWEKISRQRVKTKDVPFVRPFRHVSLKRHPYETELAVVTTPATSITIAAAGGIGTCRHGCKAIQYHSALNYSCQVSSTCRGASSFQLLTPSALPLSLNSTLCIILHFPSNSTSLKRPFYHIALQRPLSLAHTSPYSLSQSSMVICKDRPMRQLPARLE